jgi:hypothetical protein
MKNIQQILFFILYFTTISNAQIAQKDTAVFLSLQEDKAYLSFDKPYYTKGETMYFKAFLANATTHAPDTFPTVLYVDFIETVSKRVISQQKIKMVHGNASGSFNTEGSHGMVFVHAYTRWMGNLASDFHFNKSIQIFEPKDPNALVIKAKEPKKKIILPAKKIDVPEVNNDSIKKVLNGDNSSNLSTNKNTKISLQFFPEGGNLLTDFANRIAFKATDENGKGIAIKGIIKNEKEEEIQPFEDTFLGMGRFNLVVKNNEKYTAHIQNKDGSTSRFDLPEAQKNSATMVVENPKNSDDVKVVFYFSYDTLTLPNSFSIIAHQRGKLCFSKSIFIKNKRTFRIFKLNIPRSVFMEEGIATITLFDDLGKPIAERLIFIQNEKRQINVSLTTNKAIFDKRERVTVNIDAKNSDGEPVEADLSFAVTNDNKIGTPQYNEDLRAYLLLRSDLRGHIEQPSFYFEDTTSKARLALDNLLMTQGWRRFNWSEKKDSVRYKYEHGLSVEATIRRKKTVLENTQLVLFLEQANAQTISGFGETDKKGRIYLDNLSFMDTARLYAKVPNTSKTYTIEEETPLRIPLVAEPKAFLPDQPSADVNTYLDAAQAVLLSEKLRVEKEIMLQEFEVKARKKDAFENDPRINSNIFSKSYVVDENDRGSIISFLESKFVRVERNNGDILLVNGRGGAGSKSYYGLVVDGNGQMDGSILNTLFMDDIERVDIIASGDGGYMVNSMNTLTSGGADDLTGGASNMSSGRPDGVVHILTKAGDPNYRKKYGNNYNSDVPSLILTGFTSQKQFYTPDYAVQKSEYAEPDHRTTLYWSPTIKTDENGKASVSFYTTDDAQNAKILVEAIDGTGKIGVAKRVFKVN